MPEVEVDGCRLSFSVDGREGGPALLLSNPLGTTQRFWDSQMPEFMRAFRVLRYDTRGHGESAAPAGEYRLEQLGRDALGILDAAGIARAHVCGLSLGGLTAMWLASHAAPRVASLVLANTAARIATREHWQQRIDDVTARGFAAIAEAAPPRWFTEGFRARSPAIVACCQKMLTDGSRAGYNGCCAALRDADLGDVLERVSAPTLVVTGRFDPVTPPSDGAFLCAHIAGARQLALEAGHLSSIEAAGAFTTAVRDFLTD